MIVPISKDSNSLLFENLKSIFSETMDNYLIKHSRLTYVYKETQPYFLNEVFRLIGSVDDNSDPSDKV